MGARRRDHHYLFKVLLDEQFELLEAPLFMYYVMFMQMVLNAGKKHHNEVFSILGDLISVCAVSTPYYILAAPI